MTFFPPDGQFVPFAVQKGLWFVLSVGGKKMKNMKDKSKIVNSGWRLRRARKELLLRKIRQIHEINEVKTLFETHSEKLMGYLYHY